MACLLFAYQSADAFAHLASRLVGEGQGQDVPGFEAVLLQQIGYLVGQHARLARTGTGNHQLRPVAIFHRFALTLVQLFQQ